ncbi:MAG: hypothetical protein H6677_04625 [Candidatus Obscuribacterales bacterium]|nr:hypothetical protein [Candidatus Obscuribacterales bacterium]
MKPAVKKILESILFLFLSVLCLTAVFLNAIGLEPLELVFPTSQKFMMPFKYRVSAHPGKYQVWLYPYWKLPENLNQDFNQSFENLTSDFEFSMKSEDGREQVSLQRVEKSKSEGAERRKAFLLGTIEVKADGCYELIATRGTETFVIEVIRPGASRTGTAVNNQLFHDFLDRVVELR